MLLYSEACAPGSHEDYNNRAKSPAICGIPRSESLPQSESSNPKTSQKRFGTFGRYLGLRRTPRNTRIYCFVRSWPKTLKKGHFWRKFYLFGAKSIKKVKNRHFVATVYISGFGHFWVLDKRTQKAPKLWRLCTF